MYKVAAVLWIVLGTVVAGTGVVAILSTPSLEPLASKLIPAICALGFVLAIPASILLAKKIGAGSTR
ncbi:MAG: hypothetical protein WC807_13460 [Hyphomicrobium sp.]|jgi:hypothetical protein